MTLGNDGRLLEPSIDERMDHLGLERLVSGLLTAGIAAVTASLAELGVRNCRGEYRGEGVP